MGYARQGGLLEPDRDQIEIFTEALFRHAGKQGFVSVRAFHEDRAAKAVFRISPTPLTGGLKLPAYCNLLQRPERRRRRHL